MWTLSDLLSIANESSLIKNESSFEFSFDKKQNFISCTNTLKSICMYPVDMYPTDIPQSSWISQIWKNVCFVAKA